MLARASWLIALLAAFSPPALAQQAPQFGPAVNQAMASMSAAQSALEDLLRHPDVARKAASDQAVRDAMGAVQAQAAALQQVAQRVQAAAAPAGEPPVDPLTACRAANAKLLKLAHDILHLYETEDFRALLLRSYEPVLGLYRVKLENLVQDKDDQLRDQECLPGPNTGPP